MSRQVPPNELYIERVYDAPVEAVWDAWTDPKKVEKWWGPRGFTLTTHSKDLRVGGHWHYTMHGPDGTDYPNKTIYYEVEECRKLVYDHGGSDDRPPLFRVTALFSEIDGQTKLQMTMTLPSPEAAESIRKFIKEAGGYATWDRLAEYLSETGRGELRFVINRSFAAPIDAVYQAWTNAEQLSRWLPPPGFQMEFQQIDIRSGGRCVSRMSNADGVSFYVRFDYQECTPSRIVYTQRFCDDSGQTTRHPAMQEFAEVLLNTVDFTIEEDGLTRVTLTTSPVGALSPGEIQAFVDTRSSMTVGWSKSFDALESMLIR
ncbi:MAG: SRPBCC domain-containing protein [Pirellulales bacterium]